MAWDGELGQLRDVRVGFGSWASCKANKLCSGGSSRRGGEERIVPCWGCRGQAQAGQEKGGE